MFRSMVFKAQLRLYTSCCLVTHLDVSAQGCFRFFVSFEFPRLNTHLPAKARYRSDTTNRRNSNITSQHLSYKHISLVK